MRKLAGGFKTRKEIGVKNEGGQKFDFLDKIVL